MVSLQRFLEKSVALHWTIIAGHCMAGRDVLLRWARNARCAALHRLNDNEGQNALLRARVERAEREQREMKTRISQSSQPGASLAAATSADLQRQLDVARQQLAFKEQEVRALLHASGA